MSSIITNIIAISFIFSCGALFGAWWAIGRGSGGEFEADIRNSKPASLDTALETGAFNKTMK